MNSPPPPTGAPLPGPPAYEPAGTPPLPGSKPRWSKGQAEGLSALFLIVFVVWYGAQNEWNTVGTLIVLMIGVGLLFVFLVLRALFRLGEKREPTVVVMPAAPASPTAPPPGWYVDAAGSTRWFDGQRWTDITQPPRPSET